VTRHNSGRAGDTARGSGEVERSSLILPDGGPTRKYIPLDDAVIVRITRRLVILECATPSPISLWVVGNPTRLYLRWRIDHGGRSGPADLWRMPMTEAEWHAAYDLWVDDRGPAPSFEWRKL
jgi:hypothetical protein